MRKYSSAFDRITELAAHRLQVPIAIVSIFNSDRIGFRSRHDIEVLTGLVGTFAIIAFNNSVGTSDYL